MKSKVIRWLQKLHANSFYLTIAQAHEEPWRQELIDGAGKSPRNGTTRGLHGNSRRKSTKGKGKGKSKDDAENNGNHEKRQSEAAETSATVAEEGLLLACHFYKHNSHLHSKCNKGFKNISRLMTHLKRSHSLKDPACYDCKQSFPSAEHLAAHKARNTCRQVDGIPVNLLDIPMTHIGPHHKWFHIWRQLFPQSDLPESPYLTGYEHANHVFQYIERNIPTLLEGQVSRAIEAAHSNIDNTPINSDDVISAQSTYDNEQNNPSLSYISIDVATTQAGHDLSFLSIEQQGQHSASSTSAYPTDLESYEWDYINPSLLCNLNRSEVHVPQGNHNNPILDTQRGGLYTASPGDPSTLGNTGNRIHSDFPSVIPVQEPNSGLMTTIPGGAYVSDGFNMDGGASTDRIVSPPFNSSTATDQPAMIDEQDLSFSPYHYGEFGSAFM
ncbi:hypothetical protein F4810DRAFT_712706 [Camillea tinctor]|nr:hypothetical protein F4810DRAFT_712706 [Camillea tinctor]